MEQVAGVGALALVVLWGAYYMPARLRQRNQLVESRVDDRFSGSLRVLAVASDSTRPKADSDRDCTARAAKRNQLLTPPMGMVTANSSYAARGIEGKRTMEHPKAGAPESASTSARVPDSSATVASNSPRGTTTVHTSSSSQPSSGYAQSSHGAASRRPTQVTARQSSSRPSPVRPSRNTTPEAHTAPVRKTGPSPDVRARRAAAARRRLILTLSLLALSVGAWVTAAATTLLIAVPIVFTALLASVLVLGRRAVLSAQRSDAALATHRGASTPRDRARRRSESTSAVTGRAVHGSQATTELISSREISKRIAEGTSTVRTATSDAGSADSTSAVVVDDPEASRSSTANAGDKNGTAKPQVSRADVGRADDAEADEGGAELASYALPRSTYTTKAQAPRREPAPLTDEDVTTPASAVARAKAAEAAARQEAADAAADEEVEISPDGLGVDLNQILARRRAAGA